MKNATRARARAASRMPSAKPRTTMESGKRLQVAASEADEVLLDQAAEHAGFGNARATGGRSAWMLKVCVDAALAEMSGSFVISGRLFDTVGLEAAASGVTIKEWIERAVSASRHVRVAAAG